MGLFSMVLLLFDWEFSAVDVSVLGVRAVESGLAIATGEYNSNVLRSFA